MPFGKRKKKINYLEFVPYIPEETRHEKREDGSTVVYIEWKGFYHSIAQKVFHRPKFTQVKLDAHGACVWGLIDGKKNVYELSEELEKAFPGIQSALERVIKFLEILRDHHLICWKGEKNV